MTGGLVASAPMTQSWPSLPGLRRRVRHNASVFDPARGYPDVVPYLRYADPALAVRWLTDVLGAREVLRLSLPDGRVGHVELALGRAVVSLGLLADAASYVPLPTRQTLQSMPLAFADPGDHLWELTQHVRDVPPSAWGAELISNPRD